MLGFVPNLNYPETTDWYTPCGQQVNAGSGRESVVIDSVAFSTRLNQGNNGHYWFCINPSGATVECYMHAQPNTNIWFDPLNPDFSPHIRFAYTFFSNPSGGAEQYYVWLCGHANDGGDDSVYMGKANVPEAGLSKMLISITPAWVWKSLRLDGQRPIVTINSTGTTIVNLWMREDGARFSRILLTRNISYDPNGKIKCGPYP